MKISELTNKSFLGSAGAAENSYVLINYEDSETNAPVTYKATLQELGRAIANDLQLYKKTQNGAVTTTTNNGAYVNGTAENFASVGAINSAVNGLASTGYVTNAINQRHSQPNETKVANNYLKYYTSTDVLNYITLNMISGANEYVTSAIGDYAHTNLLATTSYVDSMVEGLASTGDVAGAVYGLASTGDVSNAVSSLEASDINGAASTGYVDSAVNGLASTGYVTNAVSGLTSTGYVTNAISNLVSATELGIDRANNHYGAVQNNRLKYFNSPSTTELVTVGMISGAASTGAITAAVNGLASTGYVTNAVANAGGGGSFDPIEYVEDRYENAKLTFMNDSGVLGYYGGGVSSFVPIDNYVLYDSANQVFTYRSGIYNNTLDVVWKGSGVAYIDSSDNKSCIRDEYGNFVGFLSAT